MLNSIVRAGAAVAVFSLVGVLVWLDWGGVGYRSWLRPEPILSAAAIIVGFILLSWQLKRQHSNMMEANRREAQDRLKLDIFNKIAERIEATTAPLTALGMLPTGFIGEMTIVRQQTGAASRYRFDEIQLVSRNASDSVIALMAVLEVYEIAIPEFAIFRDRLAESWRSASTSYGDFYQLAGGYLGPFSGALPSKDTDELSRLAGAAQGAAIAVEGVVWDLRVEAQNYLLGDLFPGRRVPPRVPGDRTVQVTTLDSFRGSARR